MMTNLLIETIYEALEKLVTTDKPVKIEKFYKSLGEPLTDALLVYKGQAWPGIRVADKPGHVFYNGLDRERIRKTLNKLKVSFS